MHQSIKFSGTKPAAHSCSIPFWERPENTIRWKVSEAKESFVYIAKVYNGNTLVKTFFGPEAVENAQDFIETQNSLYYSLTLSDFNIKQEVFRYDGMNNINESNTNENNIDENNTNGWAEFDTREQAEKFAKSNGYKLPVYKSI